MTRFKIKELSFGFVVIAPEHNIGRIQGTVRSIKNRYRHNTHITCAVDETTTISELEEIKKIKEISNVVKGGGTITSLLNTGLENGHKEWNIIVIAGTCVRPTLDHKYSVWIESEKDILFPIVTDYNREGFPIKIYSDFYDGTLNGLCIHQKTFNQVGKFTENQLEISKKFWGLVASDKGCVFKAILGAKIC